MPELPEVETMRRGILSVIGCRIERVEIVRCQRKPIFFGPDRQAFQKALRGNTIEAVGRVGKRVVLQVARGGRVVFEPRMTGLVLLQQPPTQEHLRLRLKLSGGDASELLYWDRRGLGSVRYVTDDEFATRYGELKLGPDALLLTAATMKARLGASRRSIKVALLDQRALAGIGNLYASEILHLARIHPQTPCQRLTALQWRRMHSATLEILHEAILHEGSTLADGTYRNALNQAGAYQNRHRVYDRAGQACGICNRAIERIVQAQRSTFFCSGCQRLPRPLKAESK